MHENILEDFYTNGNERIEWYRLTGPRRGMVTDDSSYINATPQRDSVDPADARARADDNRATGAIERESRPCGRVDPDGGGCDRARLNCHTDLE